MISDLFAEVMADDVEIFPLDYKIRNDEFSISVGG